MKNCQKCLKLQALSEYHKDKKKKDGHVDWCKVCVREYNIQYYLDNKPKKQAQFKQYYKEHSEHIRAQSKLWDINNPEQSKATSKAYRDEHKEETKNYNQKYQKEKPEIVNKHTMNWQRKNPEKVRDVARLNVKNDPEKHKLRRQKYAKENPEKINANTAKRRASNKSRILTLLPDLELDMKIIRDIYKQAKIIKQSTGIQHHVDHIIPLQSNTVSGLHVSWNLQILSQSENCAKNNKFDGTYENEGWRGVL